METKINKISDIQKEIKCSHCKDGKRKLQMFYVVPKSGKVCIIYSWCSYSFCREKGKIMKCTDIIIPKLKIGD